MTRLPASLLITLLVALTLTGCTRDPIVATPPAEPKRIASADVVKAEIQPVEITVGGSAEMNVRLAIQSGYHVNANPPTYNYLIPTELSITPTDGVSVGAISYPPPINAKFSFAEKPLAVYEGDATIKVTLKADKSAKPGERSLSAKLSIQACDDLVCYPPGTRQLTIPVVIK